MSDPLVWLPFDLDELGDLPDGLRYETFDGDPGEGGELPASAEEVELYVTPYRFSAADGEVLGRLPKLEVVQTLSAGVEHIQEWVPEGVTLCNGRGIHDTATAELAVTLTLASLRGVPDFVRQQDTATWEPVKRPSLADKQVLIVGYGQIVAAIEDRLLPFECSVIRVARSARDGVHAIADLPELLPDADVVIVIVPGTPETKGIFDADLLAKVKDGALLVNVARGSVVDTGALLRELESGRFSAALDVVDPEPLPADHPLWHAPNVLLLPHVGGNSDAMDSRGRRLVREQLHRYATGGRDALENVISGDY